MAVSGMAKRSMGARGGMERPVDAAVLEAALRIADEALGRRFLLVGALAGLALVGLPMLALAAWIKVDSPGPVFFRQARVGEQVGLTWKSSNRTPSSCSRSRFGVFSTGLPWADTSP